jgi:hypothetical protein
VDPRVRAAAAAGGIVGTGERIGLGGLLGCFASMTVYGMLSLRRLQRVGDLHGSSHWATVWEVVAAGLLAGGEGASSSVGWADGCWWTGRTGTRWSTRPRARASRAAW